MWSLLLVLCSQTFETPGDDPGVYISETGRAYVLLAHGVVASPEVYASLAAAEAASVYAAGWETADSVSRVECGAAPWLAGLCPSDASRTLLREAVAVFCLFSGVQLGYWLVNQAFPRG